MNALKRPRTNGPIARQRPARSKSSWAIAKRGESPSEGQIQMLRVLRFYRRARSKRAPVKRPVQQQLELSTGHPVVLYELKPVPATRKKTLP